MVLLKVVSLRLKNQLEIKIENNYGKKVICWLFSGGHLLSADGGPDSGACKVQDRMEGAFGE